MWEHSVGNILRNVSSHSRWREMALSDVALDFGCQLMPHRKAAVAPMASREI